HASSVSPHGSERVAPPYADAKNPANVTPTCTEARKRLASSRSRRTRSPPRPGSRSTWLSRSVSTASSDPEKKPPIVTNTTMRARLVRVPVTPASILAPARHRRPTSPERAAYRYRVAKPFPAHRGRGWAAHGLV